MICTPTGRPVSAPRPTGNDRPPLPGDVDGDGEHVREVHLGGVADLADLERRGRRHRRQDDIHLLEGRRVVARDEGAHLLGRIVVLVVDAGRQKVAAEHDAAARLGAEALRAAGLVLAGQILVARVAVAVAHRVEAGEVAEGLAGAEHVVGAHSGLGVWKLHFHQFRAHILKNSRGLFHLRPHLGRKTGRLHERGNDADLHAARALSEVGREVHVARLARAVQLVAAGKRVQRERRILHRTGEGAHLVERAAKGHHTVARHHAVGGLHGHQTAERARLADGAAVSDPSDTGTKPAATAAALPPELPPGTRSTSHGLKVGPKAEVSVEPRRRRTRPCSACRWEERRRAASFPRRSPCRGTRSRAACSRSTSCACP